ncbi:TPA: hypothetical protein I3821_002759 [Enterobacter cloacae]|nr:hypothetical protein C4L14_03940 [Enterobacter sp. RC4]HAS1202710.1 hypothetical protein [Enterobacter cloacae]HAS1683397.1 hypothetical protein [Enterobacter cloacae]
MTDPLAGVKRVHVHHGPFFNGLSQALGIINVTSLEHARSLSDLIPTEFIQKALTLTATVTLRKSKLPLESMIWLVVGMSIFCKSFHDRDSESDGYH